MNEIVGFLDREDERETEERWKIRICVGMSYLYLALFTARIQQSPWQKTATSFLRSKGSMEQGSHTAEAARPTSAFVPMLGAGLS